MQLIIAETLGIPVIFGASQQNLIHDWSPVYYKVEIGLNVYKEKLNIVVEF
jgi:hypothetical protein